MITPLAGQLAPFGAARRRRAAPAAGGVPTTIAGLSLWLDGSDPAAVVQSGGLVSQWRDKSGLGNHATAAGPLQPTLTPAAHNGLASVAFNGGQAMSGPLAVSLTTTLIVVGSMTGDSQALIEVSPDATINSEWSVFRSGGLRCRRASAGSSAGDATYSWDGYALMSFVMSPTAAIIYADGVAATSNTATCTDSTSTGYLLGELFGGYFPLIGDVSELIVYSSDLADADRATVETYLKSKWGIS